MNRSIQQKVHYLANCQQQYEQWLFVMRGGIIPPRRHQGNRYDTEPKNTTQEQARRQRQRAQP